MGGFSWVHWLIVIVLVLVLFGGRGKISELMGDVAKGIKSFRKGMADDPAQPPSASADRPHVTAGSKDDTVHSSQDHQHKV